MLADLSLPLLLGILVMTAVFIGLRQVFASDAQPVRRAVIVFAAACGLLATVWLLDNPDALADYTARVVAAGIAVVLALLAIARRALK